MDKSIVPVNQLAVRSSTCYEFSNPNEAVVVEIEDDDTSVGTVEKQMEDLKLDHQFNEKDVPEIFKRLVNNKISDLEEINLQFEGSIVLLRLDDIHIRFKKKNDDWTITYKQADTTIETFNPEKSIIDHLWFVLKNPEIKLEFFGIMDCEDLKQVLDPEKLNILLQSMADSIERQVHTHVISCEGFNEDTFLSMLKIVNPRTLTEILFDISWKEEGNYQTLKDIFETDQWKQAEYITTIGIIIPLKIEDLFHCNFFHFKVENLSPEIVLRGTKGIFNSAVHKDFHLFFENKNVDINAIIDFLRSEIDGSVITEIKYLHCKCCYKIAKSSENVFLYFHDGSISIRNYFYI